MIILNDDNGFYHDDNLYTFEDLNNLIRMQKEILEKKRILFSLDECIDIWSVHSNRVSASWLFFPEENILSHIESDNKFISLEEMLC